VAFAFDANLNVIANSGNYGSDVAVCSTGVTDFTQNFTTWFADTSKYFTRLIQTLIYLAENG
jgi:hypothetical protein